MMFLDLKLRRGNTVVYLHNTHAQVCSITTKYKKDIKSLKNLKGEKVEELTLKNNEERDLGLHLLRFTEDK
ncbi:arginine--tRNA ligase, cytoplasmic [Artemisia annua]|uniref:Arginine--tRNA ligase, cytoplasmic n=1 Tax=Artemisia annua TaxID=35608 RepID=A0A2U1M3U2_ARTAN|nr:arginine--tRNA ligase, cytoplasmic [Artemisia annua]